MTEYRNEYGDLTTDKAEAEAWRDATLEVDVREEGGEWAPWNYGGGEADAAAGNAGSDARIAAYHAAAAALTAQDWQRIGSFRAKIEIDRWKESAP